MEKNDLLPYCKYFPSIDKQMLEKYKDDKFWIKNNSNPPPLDQQCDIPFKE